MSSRLRRALRLDVLPTPSGPTTPLAPGRRSTLLVIGAVVLLGAAPASAKYTAALNGTTLQVTGDNRSDDLAIRLDPTATLIVVDVKNDGTADFTFDRAVFSSISIAAGGGNDMVRIDESAGSFTEKSIVIDGGPGRDMLIGGLGGDLIIGGDDDDFVDARRGNDTLLLGDGDDVAVWNPGDGSDIIEGQDGDDTLEFHGSNAGERVALQRNGGRVILLRDVGSILMDLNDLEAIDLSMLGGSDTVTVDDLASTDVARVTIDLGAVDGTPDGQADSIVLPGTAGADVVTVGAEDGTITVEGLVPTVSAINGDPVFDRVAFSVLGLDEVDVLGTRKPDTMTITPSPVALAARTSVDGFPMAVDVSGGGTLMVLGLGGSDTITAANGLAGLGATLVIDGGPGNDVLTGGDGDDLLIGGPGKDTVSGGRGSDLLQLGAGADVAIWRPGDGSDTVEGEGGADALEFQGANISEIIDVSAGAGRVLLTRNIGNVTMDLNGVEHVALGMIGGADQVVVHDLAGTDATDVTVDLAGTIGGAVGDGAFDSIVVDGTPDKDRMALRLDSHGVISVKRQTGTVRVAHAEPTDALTVNGLGGGDRIQVGASVATAIALTINPN